MPFRVKPEKSQGRHHLFSPTCHPRTRLDHHAAFLAQARMIYAVLRMTNSMSSLDDSWKTNTFGLFELLGAKLAGLQGSTFQIFERTFVWCFYVADNSKK